MPAFASLGPPISVGRTAKTVIRARRTRINLNPEVETALNAHTHRRPFQGVMNLTIASVRGVEPALRVPQDTIGHGSQMPRATIKLLVSHVSLESIRTLWAQRSLLTVNCVLETRTRKQEQQV